MTRDQITTITTSFNICLSNPKLSWIPSSDILLTREDLLQEVYIQFLLYYNTENILKSKGLTYFFIYRRILNIKRNYDRNIREDTPELKYFSEMEEKEIEELSLETYRDSFIRDVRMFLLSLHTDDIVLSEIEVGLIIDHYVFGYTQEELAEKYGFTTRQAVGSKLRRVLSRTKKPMRRSLLDLKYFRST